MSYDELLQKLTGDLVKSGTITEKRLEVYKMVMPEWWVSVLIALILIVCIIAIIMWVVPVYSVWASKKRGQAALAEANFGEQVAIAEAKARLKSAEMNREAEVIDAKAVADSMAEIGKALDGNEEYLRWQWIKALGDTQNDIIYVPTEANLPILEAQRKIK